jgi:hypothetical protein
MSKITVKRKDLVEDIKTTVNHANDALDAAKSSVDEGSLFKDALDDAIGWLEAAIVEIKAVKRS